MRRFFQAACAAAALAALTPAAAHTIDVADAVVRPGKLSCGIALTGTPFALRRDGEVGAGLKPGTPC